MIKKEMISLTPYARSEYEAAYEYKYEMSDGDHEELLRVLVNHPGKILLSGYENEMYNDYLSSWSKGFFMTIRENIWR